MLHMVAVSLIIHVPLSHSLSLPPSQSAHGDAAQKAGSSLGFIIIFNTPTQDSHMVQEAHSRIPLNSYRLPGPAGGFLSPVTCAIYSVDWPRVVCRDPDVSDLRILDR